MHFRSRAVALSVTAAALVAGSSLGAAVAFGAPAQHLPKGAVVFTAEHVAGVKSLVLVEGKGLVVYTFTGDKRGHAGTCTGGCAAIWPPLRGIPFVAHGPKLPGKFSRINGQIAYNGWPLYGFTGEKVRQNHADSSFPVVTVSTPSAPAPPPPPPSPTPSAGGYGY